MEGGPHLCTYKLLGTEAAPRFSELSFAPLHDRRGPATPALPGVSVGSTVTESNNQELKVWPSAGHTRPPLALPILFFLPHNVALGVGY